MPQTMRHTITIITQLGRPGMAPLTVSVAVMGAIGNVLTIWQWGAVVLMGFCAHLFGFLLNDLMDLKLDRTVPSRSQSVLVTGIISERSGWIIACTTFLISILSYVIAGGHGLGWGFLAISAALSMLYNRYSKWGTFPRFLAELSLAASVTLLYFSMALLAKAITPDVVLRGVLLGLLLLLLNSFASGLKDIHTDHDYGARSFVLVAGCTIDDDVITFSPQIIRYSITLIAAISGGTFWLLYLSAIPWWAALLVIISLIYAGLHLRWLLSATSARQIRRARPLLGGYYHYATWVLLHPLPVWMYILAVMGTCWLLWLPWQTAISNFQRRYDVVP